MKTAIFTFLMLLISTGSVADYYQAPMQQANWQVDRNAEACFLRQGIDHYGVAEFVQRVGEPLRFSIQEQRRKALVMKASLKAMPAPWMREQASSVDHQVYFDSSADFGDYGRLSVYGNDAEAMIDALLQGQFPTFVYVRDATALNMEETRVAVSAIHFSERYREFAECRNNLRLVPVIIRSAPEKTKKPLKPAKKSPQKKVTASAQNAEPNTAGKAVRRG